MTQYKISDEKKSRKGKYTCAKVTLFMLLSLYLLKILLLPQQTLPHSFLRSSLLVGHNGAGDNYPEDTLEALEIAVKNYNCDIVELDVQLSKDGEVVCIHDSTVDRTTNGTGKVSDFTLEELQKLDAGYKWPAFRGQGVKIPTLEQGIRQILDTTNDVLLLIEIKPIASQKIIDKVYELFERYPALYERALVMSFEPNVVVKFRLLDPQIATGYISFGGLTSMGCKIKALPDSFCNFASDFKILEPLDWFTLMLGKHIIPWVTGSGGLVINGLTISTEEVIDFRSRGLWVDIWGIHDEVTTRKFYDVGATVAPNVLYKLKA